MSRKNNKPPYNGKNDSQKSKNERVNELMKEQKDKIDAALITDERVAAKIAELEEKKSALDQEYEDKKKELEDSIAEQQLALDLRSENLDKQKEAQDKKEKELADTEEKTRKLCESAVQEEVQKIRDNERSIREKEKEAVYSEWETDKAKQKKELEEYIAAQRKEIDSELERAHKDRSDAETQKLEKIHSADKEIEDKRAELTDEYVKKVDDLSAKKKEYEHKLLELEEDKADLAEDKEYVARLKEKYSKYSEEEVLRLESEIEHYKTQIGFYNKRIGELDEKTARMESLLLDNEGQSLMARISELEMQLEEALKRNDELVNMPSEEEIERLRANAKELEELRIELDEQKRKRAEAEAKISAYAMSARELENARVSAAALESLNNQLQMKLKYISEQYKTTQESKFKVLLDIDKDLEEQPLRSPKGYSGTLKELCEYVRNFGAYHKKLYYSIDTIRVFFASLAASEKASRLLILQGLSGTGKSSLPRLVAESLGAECKLVPVQPSWRDNRELLGYDNDFTNRFKETEFTKYLYEASAASNRQRVFLIVLDEMNLARIEYYFADFLSVLEKPDKENWIVPLVSGYSELDEDQKPKYLNYSNEAANICVTNNIWFVGTANNDDSTSLITDKVYDRAQVLDMDEREDEFTGKRVAKVDMTLEDLLTLFEEAKTAGNMLKEADRENIRMVDEYLKDMEITFGNRIMNQMDDFVPVYVACGGTKNEAIDYLLTHKILRKLDERYEPYLIAKLTELEKGLNEIYGDGVFEQSIKKIHKLKERISG